MHRIIVATARGLRPTCTRGQCVLYVIGCVIFSLGADFFIGSRLGTDPLDVLSLGLKGTIGITVGMAQGGIAILFLAVWAAWNRRAPIISPFVTFAFCGTLIDVWIWAHVSTGLSTQPIVLLVVGVIFCAYGSSLIIMSGVGIRPMDLVAITMTRRWRAPFWLCKGLLEVLLLLSGWLLGGPCGVGTLVFLAVVGWFIQPMMAFNERSFGLANHGLARATPVSGELHVTVRRPGVIRAG
ncbi:MAG TPA: hypothetical protein VN962_14920 [Polyangia bacterium]|nr:hypothetical protein [Polyangia bacterium]